MSWGGDDAAGGSRPLSRHGLTASDQRRWMKALWHDVCALRDRYLLPIRSGWWENEVQLETLAALSVWTAQYDSGVWDDPPGKLALLYDLERVAALLREGGEPFYPERDHAAFTRYLDELGCIEFQQPTAPRHQED